MEQEKKTFSYTFSSIIPSTPRLQDQTPILDHRAFIPLLPMLRNHRFLSSQMRHLYKAEKEPSPWFDLLLLTTFSLSTPPQTLVQSQNRSSSTLNYESLVPFTLQSGFAMARMRGVTQKLMVEGLVPGTAMLTHGGLRKCLDPEGYHSTNGRSCGWISSAECTKGQLLKL